MTTENNQTVDTDKPFVSKVFKVKGEQRWLVQSKSNPKEMHSVTLEGGCNCKGYEYRKHCRHLDDVYRKIESDLNNFQPSPKKVKLEYIP